MFRYRDYYENGGKFIMRRDIGDGERILIGGVAVDVVRWCNSGDMK